MKKTKRIIIAILSVIVAIITAVSVMNYLIPRFVDSCLYSTSDIIYKGNEYRNLSILAEQYDYEIERVIGVRYIDGSKNTFYKSKNDINNDLIIVERVVPYDCTTYKVKTIEKLVYVKRDITNDDFYNPDFKYGDIISLKP